VPTQEATEPSAEVPAPVETPAAVPEAPAGDGSISEGEPVSWLRWVVPVASAQESLESSDPATLTGARLQLSDMVVATSGSGLLTIYEGQFAPDFSEVTISSGSYTASGVALRPVYAASFPILSGSLLREKTADELVDALSETLLPHRTLPDDARDIFVAYLSTSNT